MFSSRLTLAALILGCAWSGTGALAAEAPMAPPPAQGIFVAGHFRLTDPEGRTVDSDNLAGKPYALFFGFTQCPDVCPTTLSELSAALPKLPPQARDLRVYFVTVDPEHDTPEILGRYMQSFDPHIVGLSGDRAAIDEAIASFGVVAQRNVMPGGGVGYSHTASIFLIDGDGVIVDRVGAGLGPDELAKRLNRVTDSATGPAIPLR